MALNCSQCNRSRVWGNEEGMKFPTSQSTSSQVRSWLWSFLGTGKIMACCSRGTLVTAISSASPSSTGQHHWVSRVLLWSPHGQNNAVLEVKGKLSVPNGKQHPVIQSLTFLNTQTGAPGYEILHFLLSLGIYLGHSLYRLYSTSETCTWTMLGKNLLSLDFKNPHTARSCVMQLIRKY